jgi:hypothetical protein
LEQPVLLLRTGGAGGEAKALWWVRVDAQDRTAGPETEVAMKITGRQAYSVSEFALGEEVSVKRDKRTGNVLVTRQDGAVSRILPHGTMQLIRAASK